MLAVVTDATRLSAVMMQYTTPTPNADVLSPAATTAMMPPASVGPRMSDRFQLAVLSAIALKTSASPTSSGTNDWRAGMLSASTVPLKKPIQMKAQNVTEPVMMM